ncbi:glutathione S-transferase [Ancylobacter vacuolatus]|uniref:Glutathione S-transferase n=1 Tax=Ancylobacter vacuolatus TaxID=223389 RepID=A0ABU0DMV1_9HYPH|nr:glutathione S-transferase [Ancylobacter vacuolatus]MDQ0349778.1 glutathione S-transferase [Ancylobacter vacuolatus]
MSDYDFYYWPVPFRGQFIRALMAYAGKSWDEHGADEIEALMQRPPARQPVAFMGPPVLIERSSGLALSQMPAIALYLGETLGLIANEAGRRALTVKVVNDANDVLDEVTLNGGRQMWTRAKWEAYVPRLIHWMTIGEATGLRHGLIEERGYLLGTAEPGVADIVTSTLWSTMGERFPAIQEVLETHAPCLAALTRRVAAVPALAALRQRSFELYGTAYCGGEIETSLRQVLGGQSGGGA